MSLPPGFLDELRTRTSLSQVVGRKVMWDPRKSNQGKGDMWSPCPFHQEKTASFHVDDRKGFYYCFGCQAKGDAISFIRETENVSFIEAVEILARESSLPMPARDPVAQEKSDRRSELAKVMEMAVQYYRLMLKTAPATAAREYIDRRGLSQGTQDRFDVGFAPDARQGVFRHLTDKGVAADLIVDAGLAAKPDDGGAPYDRFRGRIIFPIRDPRGRCIALGGRAMDPNARAKYLNSPETVLFDKGRSLYNHGPAREACGKGQPLIVAEGYMDVIALVEAGFGAAVAPLGTAITEDQLRLLWRISPEPIIALDGDKAGVRAALRLIDLALPLVQAGQSLRFALMPEGQDPDDLIRAKGAAAVQAVLDDAQPMVNLLWRRETDGKIFDSPERKAALDKVLREKIKQIQDPSIRAHYGQAIKDLRWQLFRPPRGGQFGSSGFVKGTGKGGGKGKWNTGPKVQTDTKASILAASQGAVEHHLREAVILATVLVTPAVFDDFEYALETMDCLDPGHALLRDMILKHLHSGVGDLKDAVMMDLGSHVVENLLLHPHVVIAPSVRHAGNAEIARMTLTEELAKLKTERGLTSEIAEAEEDMRGVADEAVTWRLGQAAQARNQALRSQRDDNTEYEKGDNGVPIDKEERAALDALMERISFTKRPG